MPDSFINRTEAGRLLAEQLSHLKDRNPVVIGLPRGGVVVAAEVASALEAPLDVLVVRKVGAPRQPELGLGAIAEGGVLLLNKRLMRQVGVTKEGLQSTIDAATEELNRRLATYRGSADPVQVEGRTVILVDDGLATGSTARAAIGALQHHGAAEVVLAVPVGAPATVRELEKSVDEVVCLHAPFMLSSVGQYYEDFTQTSDKDVLAILAEARR
ncbi:MAG: hypothetical protein HKN91_14190 [Acidimicrobiia bacterium]|nr:hypothetical protein [Acidimicrobiia bacterium]